MSPFFFLFFIFTLLYPEISSASDNFTFDGFTNANLTLDGVAAVEPNGLLKLTRDIAMGHAFYPSPLQFKSPASKKPVSFSTDFVFAILSDIPRLSGHGLAFVISPTKNLSSALPSQYLGLFNISNNGNSSNHIFAIELDTVQNPEFQDINDNHVGIDINSLHSNFSTPAGYFDTTGSFKNMTLISGQPMQVWIDFYADTSQLNVTLGPVQVSKPTRPLISLPIDFASLLLDNPMYVGFSSSASDPFRTSHYILGWSFLMNGGEVKDLDFSKLPALPVTDNTGGTNVLAIWLPVVSVSVVLLLVAAAVLIVRRRMKYAEIREDWEQEYGPHRFSYKELFQATKGFKEKDLLGSGGFGRVYKGVLLTTNTEVAVKRVSHDSRQGMKEFVAEIVSIGQLRHRNLVQLLGYCRRKGELLLVYDYMPNGSLDRLLYDPNKPTLNWAQRFRIIKGVASGLLYLHEDWEQVVIHRDIKASNVLLDSELNGRLGDFGLARLYDRGTDPQTTHVVGTMGYIAPELAMTGKATTSTDVFAFGAFILEVVCGRRPIDSNVEGDKTILVDWVLGSWQKGVLVETLDSRLREEYSEYEVELALMLGLLCSHPMAGARPSMRQVMQILDGDAQLSEFLRNGARVGTPLWQYDAGFDAYVTSSNNVSVTKEIELTLASETDGFSLGSGGTAGSSTTKAYY